MCPAPRAANSCGEIGEVLDMPALIGADRDPLHVLLEGRRHDLGDTAVVPEVDDLGPCDCSSRRMMLIAASWPSNRLAAVTKRTGLTGTWRAGFSVMGRSSDVGEADRKILGRPCISVELVRITSLQASLDALAAVTTSGGRVIESARQPTGPSVPNRPLLIVSHGALGLLLGLSMALLRERGNAALQDATDIRRELGVPLLGLIDAQRKLIRDEQLEHVSRQLADLVPAGAGYEIVGQQTELVHAAVAELEPPPVPRPSLGQRYAVLVLAPDGRSGPARTVMDGVANRGYHVVGAVVVQPRTESASAEN
jgi:hypothetical protein